MKSYIENMTAKIQGLENEKLDKIAKVKTTAQQATTLTYAGVEIRIDENMKRNMEQSVIRSVGEIRAEYDVAIEVLNQSCLQHIAEEKKKLYQGLTAAEPVPTEEQLTVTGQIVRAYQHMENQGKFFEDMQFHIGNETIKALPYYFASKELFPDSPHNNEVLKALVPAISEKETELLAIEEMERIYKAFFINHQLTSKEMDGMQRIRMKQELADIEQSMKEYEAQSANQPRINEIIAALNQPGLPMVESIRLKRELAELGGIQQLNQAIAYVGK